jgi:ribosome recycling factor
MLTTLSSDLSKSLEHLANEFAKLQVGRANPAIVESLMISAYGGLQALKNIATVGTLDGQTLSIQAWDKGLLKDIERGISDANIGLNPTNNGESLLIKIPPLTQERRQEMVKMAKKLLEDGKVGIRNIRQDIMKKLQQAKTDKTLSDDELKRYETDLQKAIDTAIKTADELFDKKSADIMKI